MRKIIDLTGKRFGKLTVLQKLDSVNGFIMWKCICDCGKIVSVSGNNLRSEHTKSCGCLTREVAAIRQTKHGMGRTKTYNTWIQMKTRCNNPHSKEYNNYGGRGIKVCNRWADFNMFLQDMGDVPNGMSLDRINVNGNYEPDNCRWATIKEQQNNKRNNRVFTYKGETHTIAEWSERLNMNFKTLHQRLVRNNWPVEKALTIPVNKKLSRKQ